MPATVRNKLVGGGIHEMTESSRNRERTLLSVALVAGLLLRCLTLRYRGTDDMLDYMLWGRNSLDRGLSHGYVGTYFPLQYQIFEACMWLARALGVDPASTAVITGTSGPWPTSFAPLIFKIANLPFDVGNCVLLIALLQRWRVNLLYVLVYWLHPWFLAVFGLGYVDFQFVFFLLLSLWLLQRGDTPRAHLAAGVPFAAAALMKPQTIMLGISIAIYAVMRWKRTGRPDAAYLLVPAVLLFAAYEVYFTIALFPSLGLHAFLMLPVSYLDTGNVMPVLTANMLNIWYPIAYALKQPGAPIYSVSSKLYLLPHLQLRYAALFLVLSAMVWYASVLAASRRRLTSADRFRYLLTFTGLLVPSIMTSAHENHLFVATVLLVPLLALGADRLVWWAVHALLLIQVVNLEGLYGFDRFARWLHPRYSFEVRTTLSVLSVICFFIIGRQLYRAVQSSPSRQEAGLGSAAG